MTTVRILTGPVGWTIRIVVWGIFGLVAVGLLRIYASFTVAHHLQDCITTTGRPAVPNQSSLQFAQQLVACVDHEAGPEKLLFRATRNAVESLGKGPCRYVGTWISRRSDRPDYRIAFKKDGSFLAEPAQGGRPGGERVTGTWGVSGHRMVWLYERGMTWPPDVNPIKDESPAGFTLVEMNGTTTRYAPMEGASVGTCD